jgi:acyl-homoserine lactone acylase PvdQ
MRRFLRFTLRFAAVAGILPALLLAGFYVYLRQSLPQTKGEIRLTGLTAPAEILRDRYGIPHIFAASLRAIYDLSDLEKSLCIHSGGQSGNILSEHYEAFTKAWAKNEYIPMRAERKTLDAEPHQLLRLVPGN